MNSQNALLDGDDDKDDTNVYVKQCNAMQEKERRKKQEKNDKRGASK